MATSNTATFNLTVNDCIQEAYDRIGGDPILGYDVRSARRSLNIMFSDWANRGYNQWTVELKDVSVSQGTTSFFSGVNTAFAKMPALARSFIGNIALSLVTSIFAKKPKKMDTDQSTRQNGMFGNLTNTMESGTPIPLQYGLVRVAGQMLSGYIDSDQHGKTDVVKVEDKFGDG